MADLKLPSRTKFAFGIGQVAEGVKNTCFATFLLIYYNQVLGLSGSLAGLAIMIALCFDAITDPLAGSLSDNLRSRWGRRHPFMYASAIPLGVCFYLLFVPPAGLSELNLFLWLTVLAVLTRGAMTLYHVPHLALGAELSDDYEERTTIVSYRQAFGVIGTLLTLAMGFLVFFVDQGETKGNLIAAAYPPFALTASVLMIVSILWSALGTHDRIPSLMKPAQDGNRVTLRASLLRVFTDLLAAVRNRSFRWLFAGVIIVFVMVGVQQALALYMGNYFWEFNSDELLVVSLAPALGMLVGAPFARRINERFDKRPSVVLGTAWYTIFQLSPPILRLLGWFPENGDPLLMPIISAMYLIGGAGVVQALVTAGSMMADIADEHELQSGRRQEGIFFGALSFSGKGASGIGNLVGGVALDLIAFPPAAVPGAVPAEILQRLGMTYGPLVMGFAIVSVWCYTHYDLDRERHAEILDALEKRRSKSPA